MVCAFPLLSHRPKCNLPIDANLLTNHEVRDGERHKDRSASKENKDHKRPGVGFELLLTECSSHSMNRAGRTSKAGRDQRTLRWPQGRRVPLRRDNPTFLGVQPHRSFRSVLPALKHQDPLRSPRQKKEDFLPHRKIRTFLV